MKKFWILGLFILLIFVLFVANKRIVSNYDDRLRHAETIIFIINAYYSENNKMPSSLEEIEKFEDRVYSLMLPFEGNLMLENNEDSIVLCEKESRFVNLIQKKTIKLDVYTKHEH